MFAYYVQKSIYAHCDRRCATRDNISGSPAYAAAKPCNTVWRSLCRFVPTARLRALHDCAQSCMMSGGTRSLSLFCIIPTNILPLLVRVDILICIVRVHRTLTYTLARHRIISTRSRIHHRVKIRATRDDPVRWRIMGPSRSRVLDVVVSRRVRTRA